MSNKIKGLAISGASALIILIAAIFGINLSSDKDTKTSDTLDKSVTTTAVSSDENLEILTTSAGKTAARKTTAVNQEKNIVSKTETTVKEAESDESGDDYVEYHFRTEKLRDDHFSKHSVEFSVGFDYETAEDYEKGASDVINNPDALYKTEAEDGDGIYYIEESNEFVVLSTDGYIRTYFRPGGRKAYFDRQ